MVQVHSNLQVETLILASFGKMTFMVMGLILSQMVDHTRENGSKVRSMVMEPPLGLMEENIRANSNVIRGTGLESFFSGTVESMMGTGLTVSNMEMAFLLLKTVRKKEDGGNMEKDCSGLTSPVQWEGKPEYIERI